MQDQLGDRMKRYESVTKSSLMRRGYTVIRIDGKAFHTYTRGLLRPFDQDLMDDMDATTRYICKNIQGAKFAYTQSDEISILLTDFDTLETQAWFDNEVQKMVSVAASLATAKFNQVRVSRSLSANYGGWDAAPDPKDVKLAHFDARVFQLPNKTEVMNYFLWRQKDCIRNSISSVAQSEFPAKELQGKTGQQKIEMLLTKSVDWEGLPDDKKYGREAVKETYWLPALDPDFGVQRSRWVSVAAKPFQAHHFLSDKIPERI